MPAPWKPIQDQNGELYFYNFQTGATIQEHPCDEYYKELFREEKSKKERKRHEAMIQEGKQVYIPLSFSHFKFTEQQKLALEEQRILYETQLKATPQISSIL